MGEYKIKIPTNKNISESEKELILFFDKIYNEFKLTSKIPKSRFDAH
jgi:hypothetical protein